MTKIDGDGAATLLNPQMPDTAALPDDALRRMDHRKWLGEFARVLETKIPGRVQPMTPFRMGAITRLKLAERYVALLERELRDATEKLKARVTDIVEDIPEGR